MRNDKLEITFLKWGWFMINFLWVLGRRWCGMNGHSSLKWRTARWWCLPTRLHKLFPKAKIVGHRNLPGTTPKECPCLDAHDVFGWIEELWLEQIFILRQDSLIIILISDLLVRTDMRTMDNLFHFLEYLASFTHDGVEVFLELF